MTSCDPHSTEILGTSPTVQNNETLKTRAFPKQPASISWSRVKAENRNPIKMTGKYRHTSRGNVRVLYANGEGRTLSAVPYPVELMYDRPRRTRTSTYVALGRRRRHCSAGLMRLDVFGAVTQHARIGGTSRWARADDTDTL